MACVHFESKLYFMGGSVSYIVLDDDSYSYPTKRRYDLYNQVKQNDPAMYPPDVYVFDCLTCQLMPRDAAPPMHTGDALTFVWDGKIYVFSSTNVPKGLDRFEVYDPQLRSWTVLDTIPNSHPEFYDRHHVIASVLNSGIFTVSFSEPLCPGGYIFSYDIKHGKWSTKSILSSFYSLDRCIDPYICMPVFRRDSVVVQNTLYTAHTGTLFQGSSYEFPVLSYGPLRTANLGAADTVHKKVTPTLTPIFPIDACWPIYEETRGVSSVRLVHLGGLLEGTGKDSKCFAFVELFDPKADSYVNGCRSKGNSRSFLRFVIFEALDKNITADSSKFEKAADSLYGLSKECGPCFRARTLHASHFSSFGKFEAGYLNAAYAILS